MTEEAATIAALGERALLARLRARIPRAGAVLVGIGDDAAVVETPPLCLVTTDCLVEDVHFRRAWSPPRRLGRKALSVNLSDVGAMSGRARYATISLCLPPELEVAWLDALYDGLVERAAETGVALVGGNLAATAGPIVIDVAVIGEGGRPLLRRGARPGDLVAVTGVLGASAAGLDLLAAGLRLQDDGALAVPAHFRSPSEAEAADLRRCVSAHLDPAPPLQFAAALAAFEPVHAGMDLSDGLSGDLAALCRESGVGAEVDQEALPLAAGPAAGAWGARHPVHAALHGGEDYELLLAVDRQEFPAAATLARSHGTTLTAIGAFSEGAPEVWLRHGRERRPLPPEAHQHFARG